jgi:hypothetical protein
MLLCDAQRGQAGAAACIQHIFIAAQHGQFDDALAKGIMFVPA